MNVEDIRSIFRVIENAWIRFRQREAIFDGYRRLTYCELYEHVNALAAALKKLGLVKGDRVIVCLPNWYEFVIIYFALAKVGAILMPGNPAYQNKEWETILGTTRVAAVFCSEIDKLAACHEQLTREKFMEKIGHIITVRFSGDNLTRFEDLLKLGRTLEPVNACEIGGQDIFAGLFTSGSTGAAKCALLTHENFIYSAANVIRILQCSETDSFLVPVPFSHVFGLIPGILAAVMCGGKMVLMERYHAGQAIELIQAEKITVHYGVPTMFILELNHPSAATGDFGSLRTGIIAGAPCPEQIIRKIRTVMGCSIIVSYGATETSAGVTYTQFNDDVEIQAKTVGRAVAGTEVKIVSNKRETLANGMVGELACRGKGVMQGYALAPGRHCDALDREGWFYSGDLARMDDRGYVSIVGRKKDMIIRGGYNIYPREIEELFYTHPGVAQVSVVGIPHPVFGEATCAVIRMASGHSGATEEELKDFIVDKIAKYKVPDHILLVHSFALTQNGKINKKALRALCEAKFRQPDASRV